MQLLTPIHSFHLYLPLYFLRPLARSLLVDYCFFHFVVFLYMASIDDFHPKWHKKERYQNYMSKEESLSGNCKLTREVERRSRPRRTLTIPLKVFSLSKWYIVTDNIITKGLKEGREIRSGSG